MCVRVRVRVCSMDYGYQYAWFMMLGFTLLLSFAFWLGGLFDRFLCEKCSPDGRENFPRCCVERKLKRYSPNDHHHEKVRYYPCPFCCGPPYTYVF